MDVVVADDVSASSLRSAQAGGKEARITALAVMRLAVAPLMLQ
jgi:hypothetical protein